MAMNPFIAIAPLAKAAQTDPLTAQVQSAALNDLPYYGLAGLGAGVGLRGLYGLANLVQKRVKPRHAVYPQAITTQVPVPVGDDVTDQTKYAIDWGQALFGSKDPIHSKWNVPWYLPGAAAATGLGMAGGYKGMDALFGAQQTAEDAQEKEKAKQDFEQALLSSYSRPRGVGAGGVIKASAEKTAAEKLSEALDAVFDGFTKQSNIGLSADTTGKLGGLYGLWALGTGLPAAYWAYQSQQKNSNRSILDKAMRLRDRKAFLTRPPEIYATPQAVPMSGSEDDVENPERLADQRTFSPTM